MTPYVGQELEGAKIERIVEESLEARLTTYS